MQEYNLGKHRPNESRNCSNAGMGVEESRIGIKRGDAFCGLRSLSICERIVFANGEKFPMTLGISGVWILAESVLGTLWQDRTTSVVLLCVLFR